MDSEGNGELPEIVLHQQMAGLADRTSFYEILTFRSISSTFWWNLNHPPVSVPFSHLTSVVKPVTFPLINFKQ